MRYWRAHLVKIISREAGTTLRSALGYVDGLEALRSAVFGLTPVSVAATIYVPAEHLEAAAGMFAEPTAGRAPRGFAMLESV